jgi:(2Fe-2S) ferredoxin
MQAQPRWTASPDAARYNRRDLAACSHAPSVRARRIINGFHTPVIMDSFFKYHVFFCLNQREPGAARPCCANCNAQEMQEYAKKRVKQLGLAGPGQVRINKAGCLDRCEEGPTIVVYPEGVWYTYVDQSDIDEIVDSHLANGKIVERLLIDR